LNDFAWFLIDGDRNVNEGLELADKALRIEPESAYIMDTKGWGLYKKGKFQEAVELLEKCTQGTAYDYDISVHLEAAKKALAAQKKM
jgi:hypothetical protein